MSKFANARFVLLLLFSINLLNYFDRQLLYAVLPLIKTDLQLSDTQLGSLASAFMVVYLFAAPALAYLADRLGRKKWMVAGVFAWSAATFFSGFARNFSQLFMSRAAVGVGESSFGSISPSFVAEHFSSEHRGRALSLFSMAIPVGSALGYMAGGILGSRYGWRMAFFGAGFIGVPLALLATRLTDPRRTDEKKSPDFLASYKHLFKNKSFLAATLATAFMTFSLGGLAVWMPSFLTRQWPISIARAGLLFGATTVVAGTLGSLAGGSISDRLLKQTPSAYFMVSGIGLLMSLPLALWGLKQTSLPLALAIFGVAEFFAFLNSGPLNAVIAEVTPLPVRTMAFAINIFFIHALGDAISPVIIGSISDRLHIVSALMIGVLPLGLAGLVSLKAMRFYDEDRRSNAAAFPS
jgi:predicted MFS family arabinose efflux permease